MLASELDFASFWANNNSTELVRKEMAIMARIFVTCTYYIT